MFRDKEKYSGGIFQMSARPSPYLSRHFFVVSLLIMLALTNNGCGRLWGGLNRYRAPSTPGSIAITRQFTSIGKTSASTGTCPASGPTSGWCTGGTFASGVGDGMFNGPGKAAIDLAGGILYTGSVDEIEKFNLASGAYMSLLAYISVIGTGTCLGGVSTGWCTGGAGSAITNYSNDGGWNTPTGMDIDTAGGYMYQADLGNSRVARINLATGAMNGSIGFDFSTIGTCPFGGIAPGWCTGGTTNSHAGDGAFGAPMGVAIDPAGGFMYVVDYYYPKIQKFNLGTGAYIASIGYVTGSTGTCPAGPGATNTWCTGGTFPFFGSGTTDGALSSASGIALDVGGGFMYVADTGNNRIQKINLVSGAAIGSIGNTSATTGTCPATGATNAWCTGGTFAAGAGDGMFNAPSDVAIDTAGGFMYVTDSNNNRVVKINLITGAYIGALGNATASTGTCPASGAATTWCTGGTFASGAGDGMFSMWNGTFGSWLTLDLVNQNLIVSDSNNNRLQKFKY